MHNQMWLSGASKGKGVFGAEGSSKGTRAGGCRAKRPLLQTVTVFCVTAGTGCWVIPAFFPCLI